MIVKSSRRKKPHDSSFEKLARYIFRDAKQRDEVVNYQQFTNLSSSDIHYAILEITHTQKLNRKTRADKTEHLIVSFPLGEIPSNDALKDIEETLVTAIELKEHQRISAVHTDTAHVHLHIAINKIHPESLRNITKGNNYKALFKAARGLENKYQLQKLDSSEKLKEIIQTALAQDDANWDNLQAKLNEAGWAIKPKGRGFILYNKRTEAEVKPSYIHRKFSRQKLEAQLGAFTPGEKPHEKKQKSEAAQSIEANQKLESFESWAVENIKPILEEVLNQVAPNWQTLHAALAEHGLVIFPRGRGLIIQTADGQHAIKPSTIAREFSRAKLELLLGEFEASADDVVVKKCAYKTQPKHKTESARNLYEEFLKLKEQNIETRANRYAKGLSAKDNQIELLKREKRYRHRNITQLEHVNSYLKRRMHQNLIIEIGQKMMQIKAESKLLRDELEAEIPASKASKYRWIDFLRDKAAEGNIEALNALKNTRANKVVEVTQLPNSDFIDCHGNDAITQHILKKYTKSLIIHNNGDIDLLVNHRLLGTKLKPKNIVIRNNIIHILNTKTATLKKVAELLADGVFGEYDLHGTDRFKTKLQSMLNRQMQQRQSDG